MSETGRDRERERERERERGTLTDAAPLERDMLRTVLLSLSATQRERPSAASARPEGCAQELDAPDRPLRFRS